MLSPGISEHPEHKVQTQKMKEKVEVFMDGEKVAETLNAIKLFETGHDPVIYIPKEDIHDIEFLKFDDYHCPFKGDADLYNIKHGVHKYENAAWSYVGPYDDFKELKGLIAFYPNKVQEIRVSG